MRKEQIGIIALAIWLTSISVFMLLANSLNPEIFFVLSLVGLLLIEELIAPKYIQPAYLRYIKYILVAGIAIFGLIVVQKTMEILAQ